MMSGLYTTIENALEAVVAFASVTCTVKLAVSAVVGVPDITPADGSRDNPPGRTLPAASDQVDDPFPPVAARVWVYAAPTVPKVNVWVVTTSGSYAVSEKSLAVIAALASLTCTVKVDVPVVVGVPDMTPVEGSRAKPAGRVPDETDQVYGIFPPTAVRVWL